MMLENFIKLKKNIFENNDIEKLRNSIEKCLESFIEIPNKTELSIFSYLLNLIANEELKAEINRTKKVLNLVRFPLKFQAIERI